MQRNTRLFMLMLAVIAALLASAIGPHSVYADDGVTPEAPGEGTTVVDSPGDKTSPPEPSGDQGAPAEAEPAATVGEQTSPEESAASVGEQTSSEDPAASVDGQTPPEGSVVPTAEQPVVEEPVSATEILQQAPEGTDLVVLNNAGEVEPLATDAAAEIIATGDPIWCPNGQGPTPGSNGCTNSSGTFADLITNLAGGAYSGNGVIWVQNTYNGTDDAQIEFNGSTLTALHNLTVQGGWDGGASGNISGTSLADVSMVFVNWTGDITIKDFDIKAADGAGFGLSINNTGTVTLDNVSVDDTTLSVHGGDGAILKNTGDVTIKDSEFDKNQGNGLQVESTGTLGLDTVSASGNTLAGAYLDSCRYGSVTPGLCAGNGATTITSTVTDPITHLVIGSNLFDGNGSNGLIVDAGGGIAMDYVEANNNGLNGAILTSADANGTGNVKISQSASFTGNSNGTGLDILTDGNIDLANVTASSDNTGTILDTSVGVGTITVADSDFGNAAGNTWTGLHAESGSTIALDNVIASDNGTNGAYLDAKGDITVNNSTFNDNVHFNFPEDPGLYAKSNGGNISLTNVIADNNGYGAGAVLNTNDNGKINVTSGQYNGNGTFGIQAQSQDGAVTLNGVTASFNKVKGAYLASYGLGNIFINNNSTFVENGSYGIYATTSQGNINLDTVAVTGDNGVDDGAVGPDNLTDIGAFLKTENGGNVFVSNSTFKLNTETGLRIVSSGQVDLLDVIADQNGGNGVEVYSDYTYGCLCSGEVPSSADVYVDGGVFTNNNGYGLQVLPGPEGNLVFVNPPKTAATVFSGNVKDDFLLDTAFVPKKCAPCACGECCTPGNPGDSGNPDKPGNPNIVEVPFTGGAPVKQDCAQFSSSILKLPNGTWVNVGCPFDGYSNLEGVSKENLPGKLGAGTDFVAGATVSLTNEDGNTILNKNGTVTINFKIPQDSRGRSYSVLFWDPTLNGGKGGWVQLPLYEIGTSFPLKPDDPGDGRIIISGVQKDGDTITFTVNFPGVFVLVTP